MDSFNSQQLTPQDAYYRIFENLGQFVWGVGNVGTYNISVVAPPSSPGKGQQSDIRLSFDSAARMYVPDQCRASRQAGQNA